jgi:hypothetical protein
VGALPHCDQSFGAGDAALGVGPAARRSAGVTAVLVALGSSTSFREAADLLALTTGQAVSAETIRSGTEAAGTAVSRAAGRSNNGLHRRAGAGAVRRSARRAGRGDGWGDGALSRWLA